MRSAWFWCLISVVWFNSLTSVADSTPRAPKYMNCRERILYRTTALVIRTGLARRYQIATKFEPGAKHALLDPNRGTLLVINHPTWGIEASKVFSEVALLGVKPLIVIAESQLQNFLMGSLAKLFDVVAIPDMTTKAGDSTVLKSATLKINEALNQKRLVVIAGAGRVYRSRTETMGSMVAQLLGTKPDAHVVTAYADGLWGSRFGMAPTGGYPNIGKTILTTGLATAAQLGFGPKHPWTLTFTDQTELLSKKFGSQINETLNTIFNTTENGVNHPRRAVRHRLTWFGTTVPLPDPAIAQVAGDINAVPDEVRQATVDELIRITGAEEIRNLPLDSAELLSKHLRDHLGMDSLMAAELLTWVQEYTFGRTGVAFKAESTESILTVQDLMLAAHGAGEVKGGTHLTLPSPRWLEAPKTDRLTYTWDGVSFTHRWLEKVAADPSGVTIAEPTRGAPSNLSLLRTVLALLPKIEAIPGDRVGILLPSGVPAFAAVQAIRLAGKVPVFLNFTTGVESVRTALRITGVKHVLTSTLVLSKIKWGEAEAKTLGIDFVELEKVVKGITISEKLSVAVQSLTGAAKKLSARKVPSDAGILVTSGSTGTPKSIAITDEMLGYFIQGLLGLVDVNAGDRLLQTGPPFHVLGFIAGIALPSLTDLKVGLIPNPTEYKELAAMAELYGLNRAVSPPAFAEGMAVASVPGQLDGLKLLVYGAQAMSPAQRALVTARAPHLQINEAYGLTETTGGLAVQNAGTDGWMELLPTVDYKLLDPETNAELGIGKQGELYVRGPTIIENYVASADPELTSTSDAFVKIGSAEYFKTGDLIQLHDTHPRRIRYVTRVARTYKEKAGEFINPDLIENALGLAFSRLDTDPKGPLFSVTGAKQADGFKKSVLFSTRPMTVSEANQAILGQGLQAILRVQKVYVVKAIPLAGSGKVALATINRWATELENPDATTYSADLKEALVPSP